MSEVHKAFVSSSWLILGDKVVRLPKPLWFDVCPRGVLVARWLSDPKALDECVHMRGLEPGSCARCEGT